MSRSSKSCEQCMVDKIKCTRNEFDQCRGPWIIERNLKTGRYGSVDIIVNPEGIRYIMKTEIIVDDIDDEDYEETETPMSDKDIMMEIHYHDMAAQAGLAPEIIQIITGPTSVHMIMEFMTTTLEEELSRLTKKEQRTLIRQVEERIEELSRIKIVHGDLHAGNIMKDKNGIWKFIDFARAKKSSMPSGLAHNHNQFQMSVHMLLSKF